jgi:hypothetical protein
MQFVSTLQIFLFDIGITNPELGKSQALSQWPERHHRGESLVKVMAQRML